MRKILLFCLLTLLCAHAENGTNRNATVAFAYVGTSTGKISAFAVRANGSAAGVSGSPFSGPSQQLVGSSRFLWGTDGTNIATFIRKSDGGLFESSVINGVTHNETPQDSGVGAMSVDLSGSSLYVSELSFQGADNDAYGEFAIARNGDLGFQANSSISVDDTSLLHFSANDEFAYGHGCFFLNWDIFGFRRSTDGTLTAFNPGDTFPPNPTGDLLCPSGMSASARGFLAVTYYNRVITYRITSTGSLQEITNSVIPTNLTGVGEVRFDPTGNFLLIAGSDGIEVFRLNPDGTLKQLGFLQPGVSFLDASWDAFGHIVGISNSALYVFTFNRKGLIVTTYPVANARWLAVLPENRKKHDDRIELPE